MIEKLINTIEDFTINPFLNNIPKDYGYNLALNIFATFIGSILALAIAYFIYWLTVKKDREDKNKIAKEKEVQLLVSINDYLTPYIVLLKTALEAARNKKPILFRFEVKTLETLIEMAFQLTLRIEIKRKLVEAIFQLNNINRFVDKYEHEIKYSDYIEAQAVLLEPILKSIFDMDTDGITELTDYLKIIVPHKEDQKIIGQ